MRLFRYLADGDPRAFRAVSTVSVWALTILAVALAGGSPLQIAIFSTGAVGLFAAFTYFEGSGLLSTRFDARDDATGLATAGFANHFVESEFAAAVRGRAVTLVLFGFDRFDDFANVHGRAAADTAVREFGRILAQLTRRMNLSARYGWRADTFLSVLSNADAAGAMVYVQRVRASMAEAAARMPMPGVSVGIAEFDANMTGPHEFVQRAEEALAAARLDSGDHIQVQRAVRGREPIRRLQAI